MAVVAELTIEGDAFALGRITATEEPLHVELERVVPTEDTVCPYFWVRGEELTAFERAVRDAGAVERLTRLDRIGDRSLYRVEWAEEVVDFLGTVTDTGGTILEATGTERWQFRLRYPDRAGLAAFHQVCRERGIRVDIDRIFSPTEVEDSRYALGLTEPQREAVEIAARDGYFAVPRGTSLEAIGAELGISDQAAGERLRRGIDRVLAATVLVHEQ